MAVQTTFADPAARRAGELAEPFASHRQLGTKLAEGVVPWGYYCVPGSSDDEFTLPAAAGDVTAGNGAIAKRQNWDEPGSADEYANGDLMQTFHEGVVFVVCEDAVSAGGAVFVRHTGGNEGAFRSDADGGNASQLPNALFEESGGAGDVVKVSFKSLGA